MERKGGFNTLDEFLQSRDDLKMKLTRLKRSSNPFLKKLDPADRIKYWLALIPETFAERVRSFYRLMKLKNSVKVFTRHKVVVDYDTLFLAKQINKADRGEDFELITNARLSMMRSVICLYLAFNRDFEYHRGWSHISYALISLGATEEETLLIFSHLVQNILPGFFKASDNNSARVRVIAEFHVLAERQKYSFCSLTRASIFTTHKEDSDTMETADTKTKAALFYNDSVKNFGLLTILKTTCDEWFGSLFSNILCPKDCLTFWDHLLIYNHRLLFKFGLILLTKVNGKLEQHIKKEKKGFVDLGIEAAQHHLVLMAPALKKQLTAYLHSNDFTSVLNGSFDRRDSTLVISQDKKTSNIVQELPALIFGARLKHFNDIKKELEANIPLDSGRVLTIFQIIDDFKADKVTAKEFVSALTTHSITYPGLAVKIFSMADQNLKGHLSKKDLKCFFAIIADGFERKLKLLWKELAKAPLIDPNEAIEMLQSIDSIIHYDSTIFDENLPLVYERMIRKIPENNVSVDSFMQFVRTDKVCIPLFKEFNVIDGKTPDDGVIETESDEEDIEKTEKTEQDLKFDKSRSQRGSSPTYGELMSSKGRNSYSRKSGLGFENMTGLKEEMTSEDAGQTNEPLSPSDKEGFISSIANTEENLPGLRPPAFVVKSPMMDPKKTRVSKLKF